MSRAVKKWLVVAASIVTVLLVLFMLSRDSDVVRERSVGRFAFVEQVRITRHPYTHIAESGGDAFLPIPISNETIVSQKLISGDRTVWSSTTAHHVDVTRDGGVVVLQSHNHDEPWHIVFASGPQVDVPAPPRDSLLPNEGHDYPFDFLDWANEGPDLVLMAYTHGWRSVDRWPAARPGDAPVRMTTYVRVWAIDPHTGSSHAVRQCEMPYTKTPDWSGYGSFCDRLPQHP